MAIKPLAPVTQTFPLAAVSGVLSFVLPGLAPRAVSSAADPVADRHRWQIAD
jgi:hypothetical protein